MQVAQDVAQEAQPVVQQWGSQILTGLAGLGAAFGLGASCPIKAGPKAAPQKTGPGAGAGTGPDSGTKTPSLGDGGNSGGNGGGIRKPPAAGYNPEDDDPGDPMDIYIRNNKEQIIKNLDKNYWDAKYGKTEPNVEMLNSLYGYGSPNSVGHPAIEN